MKTKLKLKKLTLNALIALFILAASSEFIAQDKKNQIT